MTKLKPGDRVRVYGTGFRNGEAFGTSASVHNGIVRNIHGVFISVTLSSRDWICVHPKQCRKLVRKERRRIFVYPSEFSKPEAYRVYAYTKESNRNTGAIEFVEVRKKK